MPDTPTFAWYERLADEDLGFVKRFVLASGSLKEMANQYGVSYPTVRRRLDQMIAKITLLDSLIDESAFERELRLAAADGRIDATTFKNLVDAYREERSS